MPFNAVLQFANASIILSADSWVGYIFVLELDGVGESFHLGCFDLAVLEAVVLG